MTSSASDTHTIGDLISKIVSELDGDERASVHDLFDAFGNRAYGPFLFVLAVVLISPISAIPGVSILLGCMVILIAGQFFIGSGAPWIPDSIASRSMDAQQAQQKLQTVQPYLEKLDSIVKPRLTWMVNRPMQYVLMIIAVLLGFSCFPLAAVPWGVMLPGIALFALSLGFVARDGVLLIIALIMTVAVSVLIVQNL